MADALAAAADVLDCETVVEAGAAFGQTAARPPWGGLVLGSARFVEYGWRAPVLFVPELFRTDVEPLRDTLGLRLRGLGRHPSHFAADPDSWDRLREADSRRPLSFDGAFELPGGALVMRAQLMVVADAEAGGAHIVARAAIGLPAGDPAEAPGEAP